MEQTKCNGRHLHFPFSSEWLEQIVLIVSTWTLEKKRIFFCNLRCWWQEISNRGDNQMQSHNIYVAQSGKLADISIISLFRKLFREVVHNCIAAFPSLARPYFRESIQQNANDCLSYCSVELTFVLLFVWCHFFRFLVLSIGPKDIMKARRKSIASHSMNCCESEFHELQFFKWRQKNCSKRKRKMTFVLAGRFNCNATYYVYFIRMENILCLSAFEIVFFYLLRRRGPFMIRVSIAVCFCLCLLLRFDGLTKSFICLAARKEMPLSLSICIM